MYKKIPNARLPNSYSGVLGMDSLRSIPVRRIEPKATSHIGTPFTPLDLESNTMTNLEPSIDHLTTLQ